MYCTKCGHPLQAKPPTFCAECGAAQAPLPRVKKRMTYIVLAFFLGWLGIHNFYAGYTCKATVQLLLGVLLVPIFAVWCWALIEILNVHNAADGMRMQDTPFGIGCPLCAAILGGFILMAGLQFGFMATLLYFSIVAKDTESQRVRCVSGTQRLGMLATMYLNDFNSLPDGRDQQGMRQLREYGLPAPCAQGGEYHYLGSGMVLSGFGDPDLLPLFIQIGGKHANHIPICFLSGETLSVSIDPQRPLKEQIQAIMAERMHAKGRRIDWQQEPYSRLLRNLDELQVFDRQLFEHETTKVAVPAKRLDASQPL